MSHDHGHDSYAYSVSAVSSLASSCVHRVFRPLCPVYPAI